MIFCVSAPEVCSCSHIICGAVTQALQPLRSLYQPLLSYSSKKYFSLKSSKKLICPDSVVACRLLSSFPESSPASLDHLTILSSPVSQLFNVCLQILLICKFTFPLNITHFVCRKLSVSVFFSSCWC